MAFCLNPTKVGEEAIFLNFLVSVSQRNSLVIKAFQKRKVPWDEEVDLPLIIFKVRLNWQLYFEVIRPEFKPWFLKTDFPDFLSKQFKTTKYPLRYFLVTYWIENASIPRVKLYYFLQQAFTFGPVAQSTQFSKLFLFTVRIPWEMPSKWNVVPYRARTSNSSLQLPSLQKLHHSCKWLSRLGDNGRHDWNFWTIRENLQHWVIGDNFT